MREKAIEAVAKILIDTFYSREGFANIQAENILDLSELSAYFKHKPEPSGVVAKRECFCSIWRNKGNGPLPDCTLCGGTGIISRELSNAELIEWVKDSLPFYNGAKDERLELKEGV